jgi:hypothetical protein
LRPLARVLIGGGGEEEMARDEVIDRIKSHLWENGLLPGRIAARYAVEPYAHRVRRDVLVISNIAPDGHRADLFRVYKTGPEILDDHPFQEQTVVELMRIVWDFLKTDGYYTRPESQVDQ